MLDPTVSFRPHTRRPAEPWSFTPTRRRFAREVAAADLQPGREPGPPVTAHDLAELPEAARRYLGFMGVVGKPRDWSFRVGWTGLFRTAPKQHWKRCEAWQYNTSIDLARIFVMQVRFGGLPIVGRDTYVRGHGRMLVRPFDLFAIEDAVGPELDTGELVTYLDDAVFFAPSMLLVPNATWLDVDHASFDVSLRDEGRTVTGRVFIDERGAPVGFSTNDRFIADPADHAHPLTRARWTTPIDEWTIVDGRPIPASGRAIWHLPDALFTYAELHPIPESLAFNLAPSQV